MAVLYILAGVGAIVVTVAVIGGVVLLVLDGMKPGDMP